MKELLVKHDVDSLNNPDSYCKVFGRFFNYGEDIPTDIRLQCKLRDGHDGAHKAEIMWIKKNES